MTPSPTLHDLVDAVSFGDEFTVYGQRWRVVDVVTHDEHPRVRVVKHTPVGWTDQVYQLEWVDADDENEDRLVLRTKYDSHWSEWSRFPIEDIEGIVLDGPTCFLCEDRPAAGEVGTEGFEAPVCEPCLDDAQEKGWFQGDSLSEDVEQDREAECLLDGDGLRADGGDGVSTVACYCAGDNPDWDYHHPSGCGKTAQAFRHVAEASPDAAWSDPRTGNPQVRTDGGQDAPEPGDFRIPTVDELDAMRVAANLTQKELSRRAGCEPDRFNTILHRDMDPQTETMRGFLRVLQEADADAIDAANDSKRGPKPSPSTLSDATTAGESR